MRPSCFDWCKYADICMAEIVAQRKGTKGTLAQCPEKD